MPVSASQQLGECPFCERIQAGDLIAEAEHAVVFPDAFPISEGHRLVAPRRHEPDLLGLTAAEREGLWALVERTAKTLRAERSVDGLNIGVNVGSAAGQTVDHAHVHVIPRYEGDVSDPRGGIRWVLPENAAYWE